MPDLERRAPRHAAPDPGGRAERYVHAGEVLVAATPTAFSTVLGSCVAVCLFDQGRSVGGVNHILLPHPVGPERSSRFGSVAVPRLVEELLRAGARRESLQAKIFGGAAVIGHFRGRHSLGEDNVSLTRQLLEEAGIPIVEEDVGGERGRKVVFHSDVGAVWVRLL